MLKDVALLFFSTYMILNLSKTCLRLTYLRLICAQFLTSLLLQFLLFLVVACIIKYDSV